MSIISDKKFLTAKEQVRHCEQKGVQFNDISKTKAIQYLEENNNYFKLRSFRKNFIKDNSGKYVHLDFADLVDLSILDNRLRRLLLEMSISIEHFSKVHLLKILQERELDGCQIITDYVAQLTSLHKDRLLTDLYKNRNSVYCGNLCRKYCADDLTGCPVWVFIEIVSFGQYLHFYEFCVDRTKNKELNRRLYLMRVVKDLRNACAHNNCIINDLRFIGPKTNNPPLEVQSALSMLNLSKAQRQKYLRRSATYQIIVTLYTHKEIVRSHGVHKHICDELKAFKERISRDRDYQYNDIIKSIFNILIRIIDNWFNLL